MDATGYVPILKWRRGEQKALNDLAPEVRSAVTPLIEIVPASPKRRRQRALEEDLAHAARAIQGCWPQAPLLADLQLLPRDARLPDGRTALAFIHDEARRLGAPTIPVISMSWPVSELRAAAAAHRTDGLGVALRVCLNDVLNPRFPNTLAETMATLGVGAEMTDLVIDIGEAEADRLATTAAAVGVAFSRLPQRATWRSLVLASAAFPAHLGALHPGINEVDRTDWALWDGLAGLPRHPTFADYGVAHPKLPSVDPQLMRPSASIRYTSDQTWVVPRGRNVRDYRYGGFSQFTTLSRKLVAHPAFLGPSFSWGDRYIAGCAAGNEGTGNLETWRRVGTNHHITFVVRQLASRPAP